MLPEAEAADRGAPRTPSEEIVAGIFATLLGRRQIGVEESFFELGGHSLLATQAIARLREAFGIDLPLKALFEAPRVAELCERIEAARQQDGPAAAPTLEPYPRSQTEPLSFAQQRLWFLDRLLPASAMYNVPLALRLVGALDAGALDRAFAAIARRHEVLRTTFSEHQGTAVQKIHGARIEVLSCIDLSSLEPKLRSREQERRIRAEAARPFDLERGPLMRVYLARLGRDEHVLLVVLHHVVTDGWSIGVLLRELAEPLPDAGHFGASGARDPIR